MEKSRLTKPSSVRITGQKSKMALLGLLSLICTITINANGHGNDLSWNAGEQTSVTGKVTDQDGQPLPGASVVEKGTTNGTQTDFNGEFIITVSNSNAVLSISYIGFVAKEVILGADTNITIVLEEDTAQLDEVVVTALGIEKKKKSLNYSTQNVEVEELTKARSLNVLNGLSGKVAGISIQRGGSGVGSDSRVLLRGNRSIAGSSQPVYILDGVILGGTIDNLSPDDIESINVLKGPTAAALYGSRANNGAIVVTTKSGKGSGGLDINLSSTLTVENPIILIDYQNEYGQGSDGIYSENSVNSWGPRFDGGQVNHWSNDPNFGTSQYAYVAQPNNVTDFFRTGINSATNLSVGTSNENTNAYFSYTFTNAEGIIPTNKLMGHNLNVRLTTKLSDKFTVDAKVNYIRQNIDNRLDQGDGFTNPLRQIYRIPRNIRTQDAQIFQFTDAAGSNKQHYWLPNDNGGANPYWTVNNSPKKLLRERIIGLFSLKYQITQELSFLARSSMDRTIDNFTNKLFADTYIVADAGNFVVGTDTRYDWNSDVLLTFNKQINDDWVFNVNAGANHREARINNISAEASGLNVENVFSFSNAQTLISRQRLEPKDVQSVYGFGQLAYKDAIFLDATYRRDWSSTLPESFDYPSLGLTIVATDLFPSLQSDFLTFLKLRGSYAEVGNDTAPFKGSRLALLETGGNNGSITLDPTKPAEDLKEERTKALEVGADIRFLDNRIGLDLTYYKSNSTNQLFSIPVPVASGFSSVFANGADIQNKGIEAILNVRPVETNDFRWDLSFNFNKNESKVIKVREGFPTVTFGRGFLSDVRVEEGEPFGNVYSRGFQRDAQGRVIVGTNGIPLVTAGKEVKVANFNPDWQGGIQNSFNYKNLNFSFLIDIRQGGSVVSFTNTIIEADGLTQSTLVGRGGTAVFGQNIFTNETAVKEDGTPNDIQADAQAIWQFLGGRSAPVGEAFVRDASNIRLREMVLGYSLPEKLISKLPFASVDISLVGRNLFFISNKAGDIDPEVIGFSDPNTGQGAGLEFGNDGVENFAPPTTRSIGFNLNIGF